MGSESSFTPETFSFSGESGEDTAASNSLFSDTRKSLDAFLAQERQDGFLSEICTCASDEKEEDKSRKRNSDEKSEKPHTPKKNKKNNRNKQHASDTSQRTQASEATDKGFAQDKHVSFSSHASDEMVEEKEYIPSDNPVINAIHDHISEGEPLTDEEQDFIAQIVIKHLKAILSLFGEEDAVIDEYEDEDHNLIFDISQGDLAVLIGRHGFTLDGLQNVINAFVSNELHFYYPIVIDVEGYKERRRQKITSIALSAATRAKERHGKVSLAPMSAADRRLVHLTLMNDKDVTTHSEGYEPNRRVVVTVVRKNRRH